MPLVAQAFLSMAGTAGRFHDLAMRYAVRLVHHTEEEMRFAVHKVPYTEAEMHLVDGQV